MRPLVSLLTAALALGACASGRKPPPPALDASNPDATASAPTAASATLAREDTTPAEPEEAPATSSAHAGAHGPQHGGGAAPAAGPTGTRYACPMHPEVQDTQPSRCPKCGMTLTAVRAAGADAGADAHAGHGAHAGAATSSTPQPHASPPPAQHPHPQPGAAAAAATPPARGNASRVFACPMHPEVQDTKPGRCPKCGMALVAQDPQGGAQAQPRTRPGAVKERDGRADAGARSTTSGADAGTAAPRYACPMHPEVTDSKPSRCPKCGMTLTPVTTGAAPGGSSHDAHGAHGGHTPDGGTR